MSKQFMSVETVNSVLYDLAHDTDLNESAWIIPALKSHMHHYASFHMTGYDWNHCERLIDQWVAVRHGKMNCVPRSLP